MGAVLFLFNFAFEEAFVVLCCLGGVSNNSFSSLVFFLIAQTFHVRL